MKGEKGGGGGGRAVCTSTWPHEETYRSDVRPDPCHRALPELQTGIFVAPSQGQALHLRKLLLCSLGVLWGVGGGGGGGVSIRSSIRSKGASNPKLPRLKSAQDQ